MSSSEKLSPSGLSRGELEALIEHLLAENVALKQMVAGLRAEVAQLKGVKGKPTVKPAAKPSGMEQATKPPTSSRRQRERANKISPRVAREDRIVPAAVPQGSR
jgi:predicted 2-oxoglutarate/Fe(II)-dependent dioxygenase YbiX